MSLEDFTSAKFCPPAVNYTLQFSMIFLIDFMTSLYILDILRQSVIAVGALPISP